MIERGSGHIVNTASAAGVVGLPYGIAYVVSKFAVIGLTEALYSEIKHAHPGIDVSVICPTGVLTNIQDRTEIRLPRKLVTDISEEEFNHRTEEYKKIGLEIVKKQMKLLTTADKAASKYIAGIKKGKLYIFDTFISTLALGAKTNDTIYRWALRLLGRKQLKRIKAILTEMGIKVV
jgi:short-subunit dehydrogenase